MLFGNEHPHGLAMAFILGFIPIEDIVSVCSVGDQVMPDPAETNLVEAIANTFYDGSDESMLAFLEQLPLPLVFQNAQGPAPAPNTDVDAAAVVTFVTGADASTRTPEQLADFLSNLPDQDAVVEIIADLLGYRSSDLVSYLSVCGAAEGPTVTCAAEEPIVDNGSEAEAAPVEPVDDATKRADADADAQVALVLRKLIQQLKAKEATPQTKSWKREATQKVSRAFLTKKMNRKF